MKINEIEEVKKLIKYGFDLELISFELDIPFEEIKQCKLELETMKQSNLTKSHSIKEIIDSKNQESHLKMQQMRERYKKLYFTSNKIEVKQPKKLPRQQIEQINLFIAEIEETFETIKQLPKTERKKEIIVILTKLKLIEKYQLTIGQAEKLYYMLQAEELKNMSSSRTDKIDAYIDERRNLIIKKLAQAIDIAQAQSNELEELKGLDRKLTMEMQKKNQIFVGAVKSRIRNKISKIIQQQAIDKIKNDIPEDIEYIIRDIANGQLNIQKANKIIEKEAKKRVQKKPKNRFSLTEEQQKRQILIQIRTVLIEKSEQYHIDNPEKTILLMQELCGGELEQAINTVVKNLINVKKFERAKEVCNKFSGKDNQSSLSANIKILNKQIMKEEMSDIVLKGLNINVTELEERKCIELIEKSLKKGNIKLGAVSLGKSQDGLKNITLADIWGDENQKEK